MQCSSANCKTIACACYGETLPLSVQGKIKSLEQIYLFSMPVKEYQIVENFLGSALKDEVMKIMPVQKQTRAGQRTRFKAFVVVGDHAGHVGLGVKCAKEVSRAGNCIIGIKSQHDCSISQQLLQYCHVLWKCHRCCCAAAKQTGVLAASSDYLREAHGISVSVSKHVGCHSCHGPRCFVQSCVCGEHCCFLGGADAGAIHSRKYATCDPIA